MYKSKLTGIKILISMVLDGVASNNTPPKGEAFTRSPTGTQFSLPLFVSDGTREGLVLGDSTLSAR